MENKWEEEFDKQFGIVFGEIFRADIDDMVLERREKDIKAFIKNEIEKVSAEYEGKITEAEKRHKAILDKWIEDNMIDRAEARTEALEDVIALGEKIKTEIYLEGGSIMEDKWVQKYLDSIKAIEALNTPKT